MFSSVMAMSKVLQKSIIELPTTENSMHIKNISNSESEEESQPTLLRYLKDLFYVH